MSINPRMEDQDNRVVPPRARCFANDCNPEDGFEQGIGAFGRVPLNCGAQQGLDHRTGCGCLKVPSIRSSRWFDKQHVCFFLGNWAMLHTPGHDEKLPWTTRSWPLNWPMVLGRYCSEKVANFAARLMPFIAIAPIAHEALMSQIACRHLDHNPRRRTSGIPDVCHVD